MTTTTLPLTQKARAMLAALQRTGGVLAVEVEQKLQAAQATQPMQGTQVALDCDAVAQLLVAAMPTHACRILQAKRIGVGHHPDTTHGLFVSEILSMRIEKETHNGYSTPPAPKRVRRNPLTATVTMAPDADVTLLLADRDVDRRGQPLLMKVVARDGVDGAQRDLGGSRTQGGAPARLPRSACLARRQRRPPAPSTRATATCLAAPRCAPPRP
jgi:hypothetical protein